MRKLWAVRAVSMGRRSQCQRCWGLNMLDEILASDPELETKAARILPSPAEPK